MIVTCANNVYVSVKRKLHVKSTIKKKVIVKKEKKTKLRNKV